MNTSKLTRKEKILLTVIFFYIIFITFPLFSDITNIPVAYPGLFVMFAVIILYPQSILSKSAKWLLAYLGILALYVLWGHKIHINGVSSSLSVWWRLLIEAAWITPPVLMLSAIQIVNKEKLYKYIGYGSVIILVLSFIYILPLITSVSNIMREDIKEIESVRPIGLPGYALMHAYTLMILPLLVSVKKSQGLYKYLTIAILILFVYIITQTAVTTSLFVTIFAIIFIFCYRKNNIQKSILVFFFVSVLLYIMYEQGVFLWVVDNLMPFFDGTAVSFKLQDLHDSMIHGTIQGGSLTGRLDYHEISQNSFWSSPIFGGENAGGHSKFLDILGCMGLVVFIPFFMIIWKALRSYTKNSNYEFGAYVYGSFACAGVFLYEKGIFGAEGWTFMLVLAPCLILSILHKTNKKA